MDVADNAVLSHVDRLALDDDVPHAARVVDPVPGDAELAWPRVAAQEQRVVGVGGTHLGYNGSYRRL